MYIVTPSEIRAVAWEGELAPPDVARDALRAEPVVATLGQPEIWPAAEALENVVGQKWTPPLGDADFWLLRLACTLREPAGRPRLVEAEERLYLRPRNGAVGDSATYAFGLYPERLGVESKAEFTFSLGPALKFSEIEIKGGEIGATIEYRKVFPVIQSYGAGEPAPYWAFKAHAAHPLNGSQFVYAVLAAKAGAEGIRALVELVATVQTQIGPVRLGLPEEAHRHLSFRVP